MLVLTGSTRHQERMESLIVTLLILHIRVYTPRTNDKMNNVLLKQRSLMNDKRKAFVPLRQRWIAHWQVFQSLSSIDIPHIDEHRDTSSQTNSSRHQVYF